MTTTLTAPAAPNNPPPLSGGGRAALRAALVIAAAAAVVATIALLTAGAWGLSAFRLVAEHHDLPGTMRSLTVDTGDSPMRVRITADRDAGEPRVDVRMVASSRGDTARLNITEQADGTHLQVDNPQPGFLPFGDPGELTVTVPPELGRGLAVTVRQDNGVLIAQADLDQLTATSGDGSVVLRGAVRQVEVRAQNGNIWAREPVSVTESFDVATDNGDIDIGFADTAPRRIDATTRNGDVSMSLPPPGPYLVHAHSGDGSSSVRVPETTDAGRAAAEVTARSDDGNVVIETLR